MNKGELVAAMADSAGISQKDAGAALDAMFETIAAEIGKGNQVSITGWLKVEKANTSTSSLAKRATHEVNIATTLQQQAAAQKVAKMGVNNPVLLPDEVDTTIMEFVTRMGRDGQKKVCLN